jgi:predicted enzyme related to lactoylglutathione lyase
MKDAITWFDIPTEDFDRAVKFYSDILGQPIRVDTFMGQKLEVSSPWMERKV